MNEVQRATIQEVLDFLDDFADGAPDASIASRTAMNLAAELRKEFNL